MKVHENDLRRLYREHIEVKIPPSRQRCPSFDRLVRFFEGRLSNKTKRAVIDHVTSCASCYQEFAFMSQVRRYEDLLAERAPQGAPVSRRGGPLVSFVYHQAAALVVLGLLLSVAFIFWRGTPQAQERGKSASHLALIQPAGQSAFKTPFEFRWTDKAQAREYVIELFDDSLSPLWMSDRISGTIAVLPLEKAGVLAPGRTYFWMVTAYSAGAGVAESSLQEFTLAGR